MRLLLILWICLPAILCFDSLINNKASLETKNLFKTLTSHYDQYVFSGQTTFNYDDFVAKTGEIPIVRGFDMQNYSPHNPWFNWKPYDDGTVDKAIKWYHQETSQQGIVIFFWHWFSPMGGSLSTSTFYTQYTDFDVSKAIIPNTTENIALIRDFDAIAVQLKKLQDKKVPVIWRPLHEAGGKWFWWGAKTSSDTKKLYQMMYQRFTIHQQINNLIWAWSTPQIEWYPGHTLVDIMGYDSYPGSQNYGCRDDIYYQLKGIVGEKKMIQMTENGPIPDMEECLRKGIKWGIFMTWNQLTFTQNTLEHIKNIYSQPVTIKLNKKHTNLHKTSKLRTQINDFIHLATRSQ